MRSWPISVKGLRKSTKISVRISDMKMEVLEQKHGAVFGYQTGLNVYRSQPLQTAVFRRNIIYLGRNIYIKALNCSILLQCVPLFPVYVQRQLLVSPRFLFIDTKRFGLTGRHHVYRNLLFGVILFGSSSLIP
jgi:hypothetical protein